MAKYRVIPGPIQGTILTPSSKSHTLRAILFALMGRGKSVIHHPLASPDATAMKEAIQNFGAKVTTFTDRIEIQGVAGRLQVAELPAALPATKLPAAEDVIQAGNSGIVLRFIAALSSLSQAYTVVTGDYSIRHQRPVVPLLEGLKQLGVFAVSMRGDGFAPLLIKGPLQPGTATLSGEDSQFVSALLIATSFADGISHLHVKNPGEKPWIDLTLDWFERLGIRYENRHYEHYTLSGNASYNGFEVNIPGDFSSAAYPIAAALVTQSTLTLKNIDMSDTQGDKELISVLQSMGAKIEIDTASHTLTVKKGSLLQGKEIDINNFIDAVTILAVLGCFAEGETRIINAAVARTKECDRIHAIATELKKMGADIEERRDGLIIRKSSLKGKELSTYHDHRMVMSLTVAALGASGESLIDGVEAVSKTYPEFLDHFQTLNAQIIWTP